MSEKRQVSSISGSPINTETVDALDIGKEPEQKLARNLINKLFVLLKTAYVHQQNNAALIRPLQNTQETVDALFRHASEDLFRLKLVSDTFFLNATMIRMDQGTFQNAEFLRVICAELDVGEWEFRKGCGEKDFRAMMVTIVDAVRSEPSSGASLRRDLGFIQLKPPVAGAVESQSLLGLRQFVLQTYATALAFGMNMIAAWRLGKRPRLSAVKRIVQGLLDIVNKDAVTLLGLMQLRAYRKDLASHFVNVAILSLITGRCAGLDKRQLVRVGMTAFLHELGTINLPKEIIERSEPLEEAQQKELSRLPLLSVGYLVELGGEGVESLGRLISVYENRAHIPMASIYQAQMVPDAMAQIVAVADAYDHLTCPRMGNTPLRPDQVLEEILLNREGKFADWAVKLLVHGVGRYPIGTLVELNTGELGIVCDWPPEAAPADRPRIRLIKDRDGAPLERHVVVDLSEIDAGEGHLRTVQRTLDTDKEGVDVVRFFLD